MTAPLVPLSIKAPGVWGLNTEEAAGSIDPRWALQLDNAVFDASGRMAARQGWAYSTSSGNRHSSDIESIFEYQQSATVSWIVSAANNKLYTSDDAGTPAAPDPTNLNERTGTNTPTDNHWQWTNYQGSIVGGQAGHIPQYLSDPATAATNFADMSTTNCAFGTSDADFGNSILSAAGHLWVTDDTETQILISPLQMSISAGDWASATQVDTAEHWPDGYDTIVAMAEWQNRLVVFGTRSILIYTGIVDPGNDLALEDVITASGCIARDSVVSVGTDLLYLARDGLRSLARGIQFSTLPLQQLSRPVRQRLISDIQAVTDVNDIKCGYSRRHALYIARLQSTYWAFDVRAPLERGELRASRWFGIGFKSLAPSADGTLYLGQNGGVATYSGYVDNASAYQFRYRSTWTEAEADRTLIPKYALLVFDTPGNYTVTVRWAFDFIEDYESASFQLMPARTLAEWNVAEWGIGEWSGGASAIQRGRVQLGGYGDRMQIGINVQINGYAFALLRIDGFAKLGRFAA